MLAIVAVSSRHAGRDAETRWIFFEAEIQRAAGRPELTSL